MSLSSISIRRPVLAIVMSLSILLFGVIGYFNLGVREYPNVDAPIITVSTSYVGANADIIESQITEPLEESINGIAGIRSITSTSADGRSSITVEFEIEVNLEDAANDVRDRVSRTRSQLPPDADPPVVSKADADAFPIIFLNVYSEKRDLLELTDIARNLFKERLQTIPGVSQIQIWGEKRYSMKLYLDPLKMAAMGITPVDVRNAVARENLELPTGRIEGESTELTVRTVGLLKTEEDFNNLIIRESGGSLIRFREIGHAQLAPQNERTVLKRGNVPMVGVVLIPQQGANQVQIAEEFYKRLAVLEREVPEDLELGVGFDSTRFIIASIKEVQETILVAFILVLLIIFLFLRNWRSTFIPVVAIPVSVIGSFFIMYIAGFSINVLTLLGLVLAIGLVVDDAIVVLENIYKKIEAGMEPVDAAVLGSKEIFFAVISTTIALATVFLPIIFLQGTTGRLFTEFGIVIAGAVIISSFVALTLTPMLCSRLLRADAKHGKFYQTTEVFFDKLNTFYVNSLNSFMKMRWLSFPIFAIAMFFIYLFGSTLQQELAPYEDRSGIRVVATAPEGTSFEFMENYMNMLVDRVRETTPESKAIISVTAPGFSAAGSVNSGFIRLVLVDPKERVRSQQEIGLDLGMKVRSLNDARTVVIQEQSLGSGRGGLPVQFVVQSTNLDKIKEIMPKFFEKARQDPTFLVVDANLKFNKPELVVEINRSKANELGVSVSDISTTLQLGFSGQRIGYFVRDGKQYFVIGQMIREDRSKPIDLKTIYVRSSRNELVQLDNLVSISENSSPPQLYRYNRYVSVTFSASLAPGKTIGDGIASMRKVADEVLDDTFATALSGPSKDFEESSSSLIFIFLFALVLMYLVLSAQFESFRDPMIIMLTVPLAMMGALFSLWYFGETLNVFSQIGQIMLIGLVTKNGILIVEFANQKKEAGLNYMDAAVTAASLRFRPILMTSLSTILGTLPIALGFGASAGSRVSMGIAVIGGLIFSTLLSLYVVPAMYTYITSKKASSRYEDEPKN